MNTPKSRWTCWIASISLAFVLSISTAFAADGEKLFKQNCAVCHAVTDQKLTGPGLAGVFTRVPQPAEPWLIKWIKNNNTLRASGDQYANKVFKENGGAAMSTFEQLSDDDIKAILVYVKNPPAPIKKDVVVTDGETVASNEGNGMLYLLLATVVILIVLATVFRNLRYSLQNNVNRKDGKAEVEQKSFFEEAKQWLDARRRIIGWGTMIILLLGMRSCWLDLWEVGVYTGYKPEQPIKFSHKLHAGDNAIACQYCHAGVEKSRHATIPSANICMNCHKGIQQGPQYGETEIAKIYTATGFNPKSGKYENAPQPWRWVKVHNLPDHVYFNHSQHVVVGKQECKTCHGDLTKMTVAEQVQPLTMGWCIDCHRKTNVAMEGNSYYQNLHKKLAEKYKGQKEFTVSQMGGIECAKCHY